MAKKKLKSTPTSVPAERSEASPEQKQRGHGVKRMVVLDKGMTAKQIVERALKMVDKESSGGDKPGTKAD